MSLTATVTSQALAEWVKVFPKQVTETYTSSVTFMKQLTIVAVSTISYMKNVFPEESYTVENFAGIKLRILKKKCRDELAEFVSTALAQAFEAFEKKYLHKLALCFYDGDCSVCRQSNGLHKLVLCFYDDDCSADNLMEYYVFEYSYAPDGVTMDFTSKSRNNTHSTKYTFDNIRDRTVQLIRSCVVIMQTCQNKLPLSCDISLRLYYNDDAPDDYQAPGFLSTLEAADHLEGTGSMPLGEVQTSFHRFVASAYMRDAMSSHDAQPSQNAPMMTQNEFISGISTPRSETDSILSRVVCLCRRQETDDELMLTCANCGTLQHAACFGRRRAAAAKHCCTRCSDNDPKLTPTDQRIAQLSPKKRECLCIVRRTLQWCSTLPSVDVSGLMDRFRLTQVNAMKLLKLLHSNGVIKHTDDKGIMAPRIIMKDQLISLMSKYFQTDEDLVERLLAETLSPESHSDPVGKVLGPMEKVTLHNANTLGKIIEPTQDAVMEDATLKQYKEVILSNQQTEELPLSGNHNPVKNMDMIGKGTKRKAGKENVRAGVKTKRAKTKL